ncbi:hypothetical protein BDV11DRAFT_200888, partial [Aspergillus similis]
MLEEALFPSGVIVHDYIMPLCVFLLLLFFFISLSPSCPSPEDVRLHNNQIIKILYTEKSCSIALADISYA